jgi:hypothetical protein
VEADCESGRFDIVANMVHTDRTVADPKFGRKYAKIRIRARNAGRGLQRIGKDEAACFYKYPMSLTPKNWR